LKKHNNSGKKSEPTSKPTKSRGPVQRDTKEVLASHGEVSQHAPTPANGESLHPVTGEGISLRSHRTDVGMLHHTTAGILADYLGVTRGPRSQPGQWLG
jgi:hypothetical protein